jgi:pimeloyl-ACP methyl ester carboxylesterase
MSSPVPCVLHSEVRRRGDQTAKKSMSSDLVITTRATKGKKFIAEPGPTRFLKVAAGALPKPADAMTEEPWIKELFKQAVWGKDSRTGMPRGDILVFVHGYNNGHEVVMARQRRLKADLAAAGFKGAVISFDWPSAGMAINYLEDRHDAKATALQLVDDGIKLFAARQTPDCCINVHLLGHSTGAFVIREAFDDADDTEMSNASWMVSQVALIGADISSASLAANSDSTQSLYRHCTRLTNYSNHYDSVLKLSNVKRVGLAPRVGRVGLPMNHPDKAVDVDCSDYFAQLNSDPTVKAIDQTESIGSFDHSWHIGNRVFAADLFETLRGDLDRAVIPTRHPEGGRLKLRRLP